MYNMLIQNSDIKLYRSKYFSDLSTKGIQLKKSSNDIPNSVCVMEILDGEERCYIWADYEQYTNAWNLFYRDTMDYLEKQLMIGIYNWIR